MSMMDLLLGAGKQITERQTEIADVSRLSRLLGSRFTVTLHSLTMAEFDALPKEDWGVHVVLEAASDPDFRNEELRKHFTPEGRKTPLTPVELIKTLFLPGEIVNLRNIVSDLSGFGDDAVEKIEKN